MRCRKRREDAARAGSLVWQRLFTVSVRRFVWLAQELLLLCAHAVLQLLLGRCVAQRMARREAARARDGSPDLVPVTGGGDMMGGGGDDSFAAAKARWATGQLCVRQRLSRGAWF